MASFNIFGKKKQPAAEPKHAVPEPVNTSETQLELSRSSDVRKEIEQRFWELKSEASRGTYTRRAAENQKILDKYESFDEAEGENRSRLAEYERDMLIVPGGYYEDPSENNNVPRTNLDYYTKAIKILEAKFKDTSSAGAVNSGADKLEVFVAGFLDNLRNALERGYALKANASIDMIKYVFVVGHRFQDYADDAERDAIIEKRVKFLEEVGKGLINAIDQLYARVEDYRIVEEAYSKKLYDYVEKRENYDRSCPRDVQQMIESLGFKGTMSKLPPGDERRQYLNMMLQLLNSLVDMLESSMLLEAEMRDITGLKSEIDTMVFEVRRAFNDSGKTFNFDEHMRTLTMLHERNLETMRQIDRNVIARTDANITLSAKLKEIANNPLLGESVDAAAQMVQNHKFLERKNAELLENQERRKAEYEVEKKKAELEREKHRLEEKEMFLNELKEMDREIEEIKDTSDEIDIKIDEAVIENTDDSAVQVNDTREVIIEEA